jgi:hypothetical protein
VRLALKGWKNVRMCRRKSLKSLEVEAEIVHIPRLRASMNHCRIAMLLNIRSIGMPGSPIRGLIRGEARSGRLALRGWLNVKEEEFETIGSERRVR